METFVYKQRTDFRASALWVCDPEKTADVHKEVLEQIKTLGANSKQNIDELRENYTKLKSELDRVGEKADGLTKLKLDRLAEDIATRQEEMDKKYAEQKAQTELFEKRMDQLDVMLQRQFDLGKTDSEAERELREFAISTIPGTTVKAADVEPQIEHVRSLFPEYKKAFDAFLRVNGRENDLPENHRKALSVGNQSDGGFAVTPYMSNRIITRLYETSPVRALAGNENITSDAYEALVDRFDTTSSGWEGSETQAGSETSTPKMGKLRIPVHVQFARPRATQQLLEDAGINVEDWLSRKVTDKLSREEATAFVKGDGISKPRGFLTYDHGTDWGKIEQVNLGAAGALTADGFIRLKYSLKEDYINRGTWLMNRTTVAAAMQLKDGSGAYIWKPSVIQNDPSSSLLGAPIRMATDMPGVAANALALAYADWQEAYLIVDRLGITVIRDPYTHKPFVEFYFRKRLGADVVNFEAIKIGKIAV